MVSVNTAMTIQPRSKNITRKCLLLVIVLCINIYVNVSAQEQNNPLITEVLDTIDQLRNEVNELRNQNEITQYKLQTFQKNLDEQLMDIMPTTSTVPLRSTKVDSAANTQIKQLTNNMQKLEQEVSRMNGRLDKLARAIRTLEEKAPQPSALPATETEQANITPPSDTAPAIKEKAIPIKPNELSDRNEYAAYSRAISALDRADYTRLRDNLNRFLQDYPNGSYADDASYWVAESYYAEGDLDLAQSYFTQLLENYQDSEKRESALLKIAYIRLNKKQWEAARNVLELLQNEAEDEQISKLASDQLKQLESKGR